MPVTGPTVVRRQLGQRLRRLREEAIKTETDVERAKVCSRATLWRIESGKAPVKMNTVRGLCWFYGVDADTTDALAKLAIGTNEHGWWESHVDIVPDWFRLYVGLETAAAEIQTYNPELIHGLLQTSDYAREVFRAAQPDASAESIQRQVDLRLGRQWEFFNRDNPAPITAIFGAGALARQVGPDDMMSAQILHLAAMDLHEHINIRVLPWSAGAHAAFAGAFTMMDFADPEDPDLVYVESHLGARYLELPFEVEEYRRVFNLIRQQSIPIEEHR